MTLSINVFSCSGLVTLQCSDLFAKLCMIWELVLFFITTYFQESISSTEKEKKPESLKNKQM